MTATVTDVGPRPGLRPLADGSVTRTELVTPAMCGPNSLFVGQLGDWTWDAVSAACGVNAYDARDAAGNPTYLSFYYFRVRGGPALHPLDLTFGDRLQIVSRVFGYGSESVLTLHRIRRDDGTPAEPIEAEEFYRSGDDGCLRVENFNRWISRGRPDSNEGLVRASPAGFRYDHLPRLPEAYSPRRVYTAARTAGTFAPAPPADGGGGGGGGAANGGGHRFTVDYPVEASRDLNGVGLLYFASYFAVVDWATLRLWRELGRDHRDFLRRAVLDHQLCYLGNADADAVLRLELSVRPSGADPAYEVVDTVIRDRRRDAVLAVSTQHVLSQPSPGASSRPGASPGPSPRPPEPVEVSSR